MAVFILWAVVACGDKNSSEVSQKHIQKIVYVQNFKSDEDIKYYWSAGNKKIKEGTILVIKADKEAFKPRESMEPVLYVGPWPAQKLNTGQRSGYIIAIVPTLKKDEELQDIWVGKKQLPEQIESSKALKVYKAAQPQLEKLKLGEQGKAQHFSSEKELYRHLALLVKKYARAEFPELSYLLAK